MSNLEAKLIDVVVENALSKAGVKNPTLLKPHLKARLGIVGGEVMVVNAAGDAEAKTINSLVNEMRADPAFAPAFDDEKRSGIRTRADLRTMREKVEYIDAHGHEAYLALPEK